MSIVIKAQGEAQSAKLVGEAIKDNPGFIQLRRIDAARDIATTVARYGRFYCCCRVSIFLFLSPNMCMNIFARNPPGWTQ